MNIDRVKKAITDAHTELNTIIDTSFAEVKKTGKGFKTLEPLGQAAKSLLAAERNIEKAATAAAPKAAADKKGAKPKN